MGLGEKEGAEGSATRIELLGASPETQEDLLGDFLGQGRVSQNSTGETEDRAGVAPVELGERGFAGTGNGDHQRGVARVTYVRASVELLMQSMFAARPEIG